ncbi:MAG: UDP-N-acetylmuramoyl-tripeptide--D-alanyl-D-alanine ligase [Planctomycetota bacterium]
MQPFTLGRLADAIGADLLHERAQVARGVSTDTRTIQAGDVFFALSGDSFDGSRFLEQAFARGAVAAVVACDAEWAGEQPLLRVASTRQALLDFARSYRDELGYLVVAVTGSAGKTTTKDLIHHLLQGERRAVKAVKSFNNEVGVPLTLLAADATTEVVVVELGTSGPGEIARLAAVARPDVAVITCIGSSHLEGLGGVEGVAREKLSLLEHLLPGGAAALNVDDPRLRAAVPGLRARGVPVTGCGLSAGAELSGTPAGGGAGAWQVTTRVCGEPGPALELPLPGDHFVRDALLALAACARLGVPTERAARALPSFAPAAGRLALSEVGGVTLIDDTYNANPESVAAALDALAALRAPEQRVVVLGAMLELGAASEELHRAVGARVAALGAARLVVVGPEAEAIAQGAVARGFPPEQALAASDCEEAARLAVAAAAPGAAVLFKASRGARLERALEAARDLISHSPALAA